MELITLPFFKEIVRRRKAAFTLFNKSINALTISFKQVFHVEPIYRELFSGDTFTYTIASDI